MVMHSKIQWSSALGESFSFEYDIEKHDEANSVKMVHGTIYSTSGTATSSVAADSSCPEEVRSATSTKKRKAEEEVGYLVGYLIQRNNPNFHYDGDAVDQELHEFTAQLYDSRGVKCLAPRGSTLAKANITAAKGGMLLIEKMEIQHRLRGMDLGIGFLHELLALPSITKETSLVVMNPWTLNYMKYDDNTSKKNEANANKSESEKIDIARSDTIKLRRQYSRMGFKAVQNTPEYVDQWFLSMDPYKSNSKDVVASTWLSKEDAGQLEIPMIPKRYVESDKDTELKELLSSLFGEHSSWSIGTGTVQTGSKLTEAVKARMKRMVDQGASLDGINALHMAAANYKSRDLFAYLIGEHNMSTDKFDQTGSLPLHVAACCSNVAAVRILISEGAKKRAKNKDGKTARQLVDQQERSMAAFMNNFGIAGASADNESEQVKELLR